MDDLFLRLSWWLGRLPFSGLPPISLSSGLTLPRWGRSAANNLIIVIAALLLEHGAPVVGRVLAGLMVFMELFAAPLVLLWAVGWVTLTVMRRLGKTTEAVPSGTGRDMVRAYGGPLNICSSLLMVAWGIFYLLDSRVHWINLVTLIVLVAYVLAGCVMMLVNTLTRRHKSRRSMQNTPQ